MQMHGTTFSTLFLIAVGSALGASAKVNQTSPVGTLEILFEAARTEDLSLLQGLCDPWGENDGDTEQLCNLGSSPTDDEELSLEDFKDAFARARVLGAPRVSGDSAAVDFLYRIDGADAEETMNLIRRDGRWYLESF